MAAPRKVWPIVRPGYGDFDGYPEELWETRAGAVRRCAELNAPWRGTPLDRPGKRPFRVGRALEVQRGILRELTPRTKGAS